MSRWKANTEKLLPAAIAWVPAPALAQQLPASDRYACGPYMMGWGGGNGMFFAPLIMILVVALVIAVAVLLFRWLASPWHTAPPPHQILPERTALDILKERYARGEINKEEFEERRRTLGD